MLMYRGANRARTTSDHIRHLFRSSLTSSFPAGISPVAVTKFPSTLCASTSFSWARNFSTSVLENCSIHISVQLKPGLGKAEPTFVLVFAREIDRNIEISFSFMAGKSWVSLPSLPRSWSRSSWQTLSRFERRVMSFGEYDESVSAFFTMPRSLSIVCVTCSKSLDEYRSTSRRCSSKSFMVDVKA